MADQSGEDRANEGAADTLLPLEQVAIDDTHRTMPQQDTVHDDWVHLGDEEEAEDQTVNLGVWRRQVESRLKAVPDSADKYQTALSAIGQLQELFGEVDEKKEKSKSLQKLPFSFDDLCRSISVRQDGLFKRLVEFQREEQEDIEHRISEIEAGMNDEEMEDDFVQRQRYLLSDEETRRSLESCASDLMAMIDSPKPTPQSSFVHQQVQHIDKAESAACPKSQVYKDNEVIRNRSTMLLLKCHDIGRLLDAKIANIEQKQDETRKIFQSDLEEVEDWLISACSLLCQEPIRDVIGGAYSQEGDGFERQEANDPGYLYDSAEDLLPSEDSGSSVGVGPGALETSVDADLNDDEYMDQINQRVFSPVDEGPFPPEAPLAGSLFDRRDSTDLDAVLSKDMGLEGVDATSAESELHLSSEVDAVTVTSTDNESTASGDTLRADQGGNKERTIGFERKLSSDVDSARGAEEFSDKMVKDGDEQGTEFSEEEVITDERIEETDHQRDTEIEGDKEQEEGSPLSDGSPSGGDTLASREEQSGTYIIEGESQSEGTCSEEWQEEIHLLPMLHDPMLDQYLPCTGPHLRHSNVDEILGNIQVTLDELPVQSDKIKQAVANINLMLSTVDKSVADDLSRRLCVVEKIWEDLEDQLSIRGAELRFEKTQLSILVCISEARDQLQVQPCHLLLAADVTERLDALMHYFVPEQYDNMKEDALSELNNSLEALEALEGVEPKGAESGGWRITTESLKQVYDAITDKVTAQKSFLEECLSLWSRFESGYEQLREWMDKAEDMVARETYGYDVQETEAYLSTVKKLKEQLPSQEEQVSTVFQLGSEMQEKMESGDDPQVFVDQQLTTFEQRWTDLVTQGSGTIDALESAVNMVLVKWKKYVGMHEGARSFIKQMVKMVGTEPLETSNGDYTMLSTYKAYQDQLIGFEAHYNRLVAVGNELASNERVGSRDGIRNEIEALKLQWEPLKDNINDSLHLLISEYNDWIMVKLQKMEGLVEQVEELVKQKIQFVENFPLDDLLNEDATELLKEADLLVASQDQLDQIENDCTSIEEELLQRQIEQETTSSLAPSASSIELPATRLKKQGLLESREKFQTTSDALQPIVNVFYLQLQLLQNIQEGQEMVAKAIDYVGEHGELETLYTELEIKLSGDFFENLSSEAYDLGVVAEDCESSMEEMGEQEEFKLPAYQEISKVNRSLGDAFDSLNTSADEAKIRLRLFVQWWEEYRDNHGDLGPWLEGAETRLVQLTARAESTQPPLVSPGELLVDTKELQTEAEEKQVVLNALVSTSKNIVDEMEAKGSPPGEIADQITNIQDRFVTLCDGLSLRIKDWEVEADKFDSYLTRLTGFANWLNEFHSALYDEVCIRIPSKASNETVARHKAKLEEYRQVVLSRTPEFDCLEAESERWGDYLVPDETVGNLPSPSEPSPPPFTDEEDFPPEVQLPYIKKRVSSTSKKWSKVQQVLLDRAHQLEMSSGGMQTFFETLQNLSDWIDGKLKQDLLASLPPGNVNTLNEYLQDLQALRNELGQQVPVKESLSRSVVALREELSGVNVELVNRRMEELEEQWRKLEAGKDEREKVCQALLSRIEEFWTAHGVLETWVTEREASLTDCGPIGANLPRLSEQMETLKILDDDLLGKKKDPEEIVTEATNILRDCLKESGQEISDKCGELEQRFEVLSQNSAERQELCEEALSAMQEFQKKVDCFTDWLEKMEINLEAEKENKKPIGTVQLQLDEFYDYMRDIEAHTDDYLALCPEAKELSDKYKPSDVLDEMMSLLHDRWSAYVGELQNRCEVLIGLVVLWNRYEAEVKGLLDWITTEANSFSKEVTTRDEKGVEDHIESCKVFTNTLTTKKKEILDIEDLAVALRVEDGVKKNGTSDVDSRWNDVNQHWDSLCKLLAETMLHLESTYAEVCQVNLIRTEEFKWLADSEEAATERVRTGGEISAVELEIETHSQLLTEVHNHKEECEFVEKTVPFLVEHLRGSQRELVKTQAEDHCQRYHTLSSSLDTYVHNLEESIPYWEEFKQQTRDLAQWVDWANKELVSERLMSGNATMTQASLGNAQNLFQDSVSHQQDVNTATCTGSVLQRLVIPDDGQYIADTLDCLENGCKEVNLQTEEQVEELEERLKSWQVFPVEEAIVVQKFLEEVGNIVDEEMEEEMSSEQLMEKLEQLEAFQEVQQTNESKMSTIEQSAGSEEMQKALEKNPDISKERNNLLQGWSSVSDSLKVRISMMKQKAHMVSELESLLKSCEQGLNEYRKLLETPLPPSVLLATAGPDIRQRTELLHNRCQSDLSNLHSTLNKYDSPDTQAPAVPNHLQTKSTSYKEQFNDLSAKAEEVTNQIEDTISSWNEFQSCLTDLSKWCRSAGSELSTLRVVENFATEFSSLESRFQLLRDEIEDKASGFNFLSQTSPRHCAGDSAEVVKVKERYVKLQQSWQSIQDGMKSLPEIMQPWKELTDLFDHLYNSFKVLENQVERDILITDDQAEGYLSDLIVTLKDHLLKLTQHTPGLQKLHELEDRLLTTQTCQKYEPASELKEDCIKIEADFDTLRRKVQDTLTDLEKQERRWKIKASTSIQRLPQLEHQLAIANDENITITNTAEAEKRTLLADIATQEATINDLQRRLLAIPIQVQQPSYKFSKIFFAFLSLILIFIAIVCVLGLYLDVSPPNVRVM